MIYKNSHFDEKISTPSEEFKKIYINIWLSTFQQLLECLAKFFAIHPKNTSAYNYLLDYFHDKYESWTISQKTQIESMLNQMIDIHKTSISNLKKEMLSLKTLLKWFKEETFTNNKVDIMLRKPEEITEIFDNIQNYGEKERVKIEQNINIILKNRKELEKNILEKFDSMYDKCQRLMFL